MASALLTSLRCLAVMTVLTGAFYPAVVTVLAGASFPVEAKGSVIVVKGRAVASRLIGQSFSAPGYFHARPSATAHVPYDASASAGSNLGPSNPALAEAVSARIAALDALNGPVRPIPADLVTTSASGLDVHITPQAAAYQVARVARARGLSIETVESLVRDHTEGPWLGLFGEPRVNVVTLNLALRGVAP